MESGRPVEILSRISDVGNSVYCIENNLDDSFLAYGKNDGRVTVIDAHFEIVQELEATPVKMPVSHVKWRKAQGFTKNLLFVSSSEGTISDWHAISGKQLYSQKLPGDDYGACCDFSPDGESFVLGCKEGLLRIFDDTTKQEMQVLRKNETKLGHTNLILCAKWISHNSIISGSMDGSVILWDVRTGNVCKFFGGFSFYGNSIDVNSDQLLTADSSNKDQVKLWSISQGKMINSITLVERNRPFRGYTAQFCKGTSSGLAFIGGNGAIQGYYIDGGTLTVLGGISSIGQPIYCCDFCNNSSKLAIGSSNGSLCLTLMSTRDLSRPNKAES
jgi:WD40 repeat protein